MEVLYFEHIDEYIKKNNPEKIIFHDSYLFLNEDDHQEMTEKIFRSFDELSMSNINFNFWLLEHSFVGCAMYLVVVSNKFLQNKEVINFVKEHYTYNYKDKIIRSAFNLESYWN